MKLEDLNIENLKGTLDVTITLESEDTEITSEKAIEKMAQDVIAGKYGSGTDRKENLYKAIQTKVNEIA